MFSLVKPIGLLLVGVAFLLLGSGLLNTLIALRSELEGYNSTMIGAIMSGYFIGFFVGTYLAMPIINRIGHIRAFAFCAAIVAISVLMHTLMISSITWLMIRILTGVALVVLYTIIESWLNGQTPAEHRGKVFAIYMTVNLSSLALAQQLLRLDAQLSFTLFAVATLFICFSVLPVTWTRMQQPEIHHVPRIKLSQLFSAAPLALVASLFSGLAMGAFWGLSALYASQLGLTNQQIAMFMTSAILGGALLQFPIGRYSDNHDRGFVITAISISAALVAMMAAVTAAHHGFFYLLIAIYGGLAFAIYPLAIAHMVDHLEPENMLGGGSNMLLLHGVGAMIGPVFAGKIMQLTGPASLPIYWAVVHALIASYAFYSMKKMTSNPGAEHGAEFVPMVRTTPTALEMLPADEYADHEDESEAMWSGTDNH